MQRTLSTLFSPIFSTLPFTHFTPMNTGLLPIFPGHGKHASISGYHTGGYCKGWEDPPQRAISLFHSDFLLTCHFLRETFLGDLSQNSTFPTSTTFSSFFLYFSSQHSVTIWYITYIFMYYSWVIVHSHSRMSASVNREFVFYYSILVTQTVPDT